MTWPLPLVATDEPGAEVVAEQDGTIVRRTVLPGGARVFTEHMPGLRSATFGAWVGVGSRDETEGHYGSTHFLEHLLFKGTDSRSAMDIAAAFDAVGGEANAATGKEHTCYYARVLDTDLPMAIDVIGDMVTSATIDPDEVEVERGVILEELAMNEDDPADVVHEHFAAAVMGDNPLGRPIGGTPDSIRSVSRDRIWDHYKSNYRPDTMVFSAAGGVDHDEVVAMVSDTLERGGWDLSGSVVPVPRRSASLDLAGIPNEGSVREIYRPVEQANVIIGSTGPSATDSRRWALTVLNAVLGGSMSSRLFQEIRERRGLAYSTYSFAAGYGGIGSFGLYAGCAPRNVEEVEKLMHGELEKIAEHGITKAELERAIGQLSGGVVLGMEDSGSRMSRLGRAELVHGEFLGLAESLNRVQAVTNEDVQSLAADLANRPRTTVRVGPFGEPTEK
jgi:predicted Zn-dependent peptidase